MNKFKITARILPDGKPIVVVGRDAWALRKLFVAGPRGCTPITTPGPRWSQYVFKLRGMGFAIDTFHEPHGGPFAGTHARYVMRSHVEMLNVAEAIAA